MSHNNIIESPANGVSVRRSQTEAFRDAIVENYKSKIHDLERAKQPRFKVAMLDAEVLAVTIDPTFPEREHWVRRYQEFQIERGGKSHSYIRSLNTTMRAWDSFCAEREAYSYPAHPRTVALWFDTLRAQGKKFNTIRQHRAMLSYLFETIFGLVPESNPAKDELIVSTVLRATKRDNLESDTVTERELQALPLRLSDIKALHAITTRKNAKYFRDLVFISLCYATMLRVSEVRTLKRWQIQEHLNQKGDYQIIRVYSKTTDSPEPKTVKGDFASLLRDYLDRFCTNIGQNEYIFSELTHYSGFKDPTKPMSLKCAIEIFARVHRRLYGETQDQQLGRRDTFTAHSCRVGGVIDGMVLHHLTITQLMLLGDWKSESMLARYLRGVVETQNTKIQTNFMDSGIG